MKGKQLLGLWDRLVPSVLLFAAAVLLMSLPAGLYLARSVSVGVLFALSGGIAVAAFFTGREENIFRLLSGVAQLSAALWMLVIITTPLYVFCVALAAIAALRAGGEILDGIRKEKGAFRILRCACAVLVIGALIVVPCDPFGTALPLLVYTGAVLLVFSVIEIFFAWTGSERKEA